MSTSSPSPIIKVVVGQWQGPQGPPGAPGTPGGQGPAGPPGPVGPSGLTWEGQWNADTDYPQNSAVGYQNATYFATRDVGAGGQNPVASSTPGGDGNWALVATQGPQGPPGPLGPPGPEGPGVYFGPTAPTVPGPWTWYETVVGVLVDIHVEA